MSFLYAFIFHETNYLKLIEKRITKMKIDLAEESIRY